MAKPTTQKAMGKNQLVKRLTAQVGSEGMAIALLKKRGDMEPGSTKLTPKGQKRNAMTAEERAKDRAAKASTTAHPAKDFTYSPRTNRATLRKK
jgi:hypothetical protein